MKKEKTVKAAKAPKLVSYTIKATIPTCQYGNIQPEITVMAGTIEEAENFVLPRINKLFADYAEEPINKRLRFINKVPVQEPVEVVPTGAGLAPFSKEGLESAVALARKQYPEKNTPITSLNHSEALVRTLKVIESCKSNDTLKVIAAQIASSIKLTPKEIEIALSVIAQKNV